MPHQVGERLRCEDCGAEIVYTKACSCSERDPKTHADICCGKEMRNLGVEGATEQQPRKASGF
ncbi:MULTISPECIES: hypothetical protein [Polyangium]|uniref:Desulforedoxin n=2 Tax=Polyangium TaxID=55 RepID=A0A4U1JD82_9BACT|nr:MULTISPECIES: hypothetical protein [Polyangium]MDI1433841.1 hypothetical protein [Polyangium sorediatum]TKD08654.1 hypothetical protein E8A74_15345 [Polyangium fumosum]